MSDAAEPLDLDAIREEHSHTYPHYSTANCCSECDEWAPCTTRRLLAEVDRLRAALATARRDATGEGT